MKFIPLRGLRGDRQPKFHLHAQCPKCGAGVGKHCVSRRGVATPSAPHLERVRLVRGGPPLRWY